MKRIQTRKGKAGRDGLIRIQVGDKVVQLDRPEAVGNAVAVKNRLRQLSKRDLLDVFVHQNRDGSFAVATGAEPDVWPEDREER